MQLRLWVPSCIRNKGPFTPGRANLPVVQTNLDCCDRLHDLEDIAILWVKSLVTRGNRLQCWGACFQKNREKYLLNLSERAISTASIAAYWCNNSEFVMEVLMGAQPGAAGILRRAPVSVATELQSCYSGAGTGPLQAVR